MLPLHSIPLPLHSALYIVSSMFDFSYRQCVQQQQQQFNLLITGYMDNDQVCYQSIYRWCL